MLAARTTLTPSHITSCSQPLPPHQANSACCEDNPDALTHHELLLPGHLLVKFLREKLEDCLAMFK